MTIHRRNAKRDANEPEIIAFLKAAGASVERLSTKGLPDLLIGYRQKTYLVEVKGEGKKLNANQVDFVSGWKGWPVVVIRSIADAKDWLEEIR